MTEETTRDGLDFGALRAAIEHCDPDALVGFYAEDAELRIENAALPDGPAFELKGGPQIERYLRAVCDQQMTRLLEDEAVFGEASIEFFEVCSYPTGTPILIRTTLEVARGLIVRQSDVVVHAHRDAGGGTSAGQDPHDSEEGGKRRNKPEHARNSASKVRKRAERRR